MVFIHKEGEIKMRFLSLLAIFLLLGQLNFVSVQARPGETLDTVIKKYNLEGQQPVMQDEYLSYRVNYSKFVSQPTLFFKVGAKNIVLEENFLFDKNTVHEKDVQRAKVDTKPIVAIPRHAYLVGDFSQLPREQFDVKSRWIGAAASPFGAAFGSFIGAGKGLYEGTKIGVKTANSASQALGGDASGKAAAVASTTTAVATGAVTGLFAGLTGGAVEGSVRGARVAIEGFSGADRQITGVTAVQAPYVIIGGRIGKELTLEEQKDLLNKLSKLEEARLAGLGQGTEDIATNPTKSTDLPVPEVDQDLISSLDSAKDKMGFEQSSSYAKEDASNRNVAGMW